MQVGHRWLRNQKWDEVESDYKRGLGLNPNYATGHQWYSEYLVPVGRLEEAQKEIGRAQELDPLSLVINVRAGMTSYSHVNSRCRKNS